MGALAYAFQMQDCALPPPKSISKLLQLDQWLLLHEVRLSHFHDRNFLSTLHSVAMPPTDGLFAPRLSILNPE
jgi:hypothetical protein